MRSSRSTPPASSTAALGCCCRAWRMWICGRRSSGGSSARWRRCSSPCARCGRARGVPGGARMRSCGSGRLPRWIWRLYVGVNDDSITFLIGRWIHSSLEHERRVEVPGPRVADHGAQGLIERYPVSPVFFPVWHHVQHAPEPRPPVAAKQQAALPVFHLRHHGAARSQHVPDLSRPDDVRVRPGRDLRDEDLPARRVLFEGDAQRGRHGHLHAPSGRGRHRDLGHRDVVWWLQLHHHLPDDPPVPQHDVGCVRCVDIVVDEGRGRARGLLGGHPRHEPVQRAESVLSIGR
mmetsp:Transcript_305/g.1426  ORF Transcript_305/g.1426 Transcript_305/m.1426 type:complete len:291 (+) Transcript_305:1094-1966(+)